MTRFAYYFETNPIAKSISGTTTSTMSEEIDHHLRKAGEAARKCMAELQEENERLENIIREMQKKHRKHEEHQQAEMRKCEEELCRKNKILFDEVNRLRQQLLDTQDQLTVSRDENKKANHIISKYLLKKTSPSSGSAIYSLKSNHHPSSANLNSASGLSSHLLSQPRMMCNLSDNQHTAYHHHTLG